MNRLKRFLRSAIRELEQERRARRKARTLEAFRMAYEDHREEEERPVVFCCVDCGREQAKREKINGIGITSEEAKLIGWESRSDGWRCPFCAGNVRRGAF